MSDRYCLPLLTLHDGVPSSRAALVVGAFRKLPRPVVAGLWRHKVGVWVRETFRDLDGIDGWRDLYPGEKWETCLGYWERSGGWAVVNGERVTDQPTMDAVVLHEIGHALSDTVLPHPHRGAPFREAWKTGRSRARTRFPADSAARRNLGVFDIHWTRATSEVWAESFAWLLGARVTTHPAFGECYAECIDLVGVEVGNLAGAPA